MSKSRVLVSLRFSKGVSTLNEQKARFGNALSEIRNVFSLYFWRQCLGCTQNLILLGKVKVQC